MSDLPPDATIAYLLEKRLLSKPADWIALVFSNIRALQKDYGPCCVRIGITGSGHSPNYRIEPISAPEMTSEDIVESGDIPDTRFWSNHIARNTAYSGRSHKVLTTGLDREHWSAKATSLQDIGDLLLLARKLS